ncbi:hypothetical protein GALMADRAFT_69340 [Galerina marginata CBS 339.88]|uniref:Uncharacterized protein n=1 Tax=Galerina marginata (strain CBS 339.88) TaxID=685588 RepID=A0A067SYC3_GALM3|nr:hypothetical protein GALMADRAFT_69340 [Galerina marginata CBS 339.88]
MAANAGLSNGIICTPDQYERSKTDDSIHCLTRGESIGLTIIAQAGLISLVAVSCVFVIILRNLVWRIRHVPREKWRVFHQPMDLLMFSLFSADVLQAIGAVMDVKWIQDGKVESGNFCNAQGIIQQLGETGVAMTTLAIAVYTFLGIWMGKGIKSIWITRAVVSLGWLFILLMVVIGTTVKRGPGKHYESPTPYWCWISEDYLQMRIWGEYFWFWITLAFSIVIYVPLYLWSRGNIIIDNHSWWKFTFQKASLNADPGQRGVRRRSLIMLAYPLVYCVSILPISVVRWIGFIQERNGGTSRISSTATAVVSTIYGLSGVCNVILLLTTRPESVLFGKYSNFSSGHAPPSIVSSRHDDHSSQEVLGFDKGDNELGMLPAR